jgi:hypothetical protein
LVSKDPTALSHLLGRFADLLRTGETLGRVRFDESDFARAVERALSRLGQAFGPQTRALLFRDAIAELADHRATRHLHDQLARAVRAPTLSGPNREAVAAALVCLEPAAGRWAVPASESPTLEIIFNVQLEAWMESLDARALELKAALRESG